MNKAQNLEEFLGPPPPPDLRLFTNTHLILTRGDIDV